MKKSLVVYCVAPPPSPLSLPSPLHCIYILWNLEQSLLRFFSPVPTFPLFLISFLWHFPPHFYVSFYNLNPTPPSPLHVTKYFFFVTKCILKFSVTSCCHLVLFTEEQRELFSSSAVYFLLFFGSPDCWLGWFSSGVLMVKYGITVSSSEFPELWILLLMLGSFFLQRLWSREKK